MAQVFISYSRRDKEFVKKLVAVLEAEKREVWLDEKDIEVTAEWLKEIFSNIEAADNFVFIISPHPASPRSTPEKRSITPQSTASCMVPIYYRAVPDDDIPEAVAKFQRIDFTGTTDFDSNFANLTKALDTDLDLKQTHTRLLIRAREWERSETDRSFLLRGKDLSEAEQWIVRSAEKEPKPTALHSQYILASRQAAVRTQRIIIGAIAVALAVAIGLASYANRQRNVAESPVEWKAQKQKNVADANATEATRQEKAATKRKRPTHNKNARESKARELAAYSTGKSQ